MLEYDFPKLTKSQREDFSPWIRTLYFERLIQFPIWIGLMFLFVGMRAFDSHTQIILALAIIVIFRSVDEYLLRKLYREIGEAGESLVAKSEERIIRLVIFLVFTVGILIWMW